MTDEQLDQLVREADPGRPGIIRHLDGAEQILLEEIMSVPTLDRVAEPQRRRPTRRRSLIGGAAGALAVAAAVTGVLVVSNLPGETRGGGPAEHAQGALVYSAAVLKAAQENPRLLIDEPGWQVTTVYGFAEKTGTIVFTNGGRSLEMNWYPAEQYRAYHVDRLRVSEPRPAKVDGWPGELFVYNDSDFAVMLTPRDKVFVELRTGGGWNRGLFDKVLTHVEQVDVRTWLAAMPAGVVTPGREAAAATEVIKDVPLPPEFDVAALSGLGTNDPYQFGAEVTGRIGCAWIAEWERAKRAGDKAAVDKAGAAMSGSHTWKVLVRMEGEGGWSQVFWEYADEVAAGRAPQGYRQGLGCDNHR